MKKGPYLLIDSKKIYKSHWLEIKEDTVILPDSKEGTFTTVENLPGVSVAAINKAGEIYLIKEYYYVLEDYGIQLPSGGIEPNEEPLEAAKKELLEEAGVVAKNWFDLGFINPLTMFVKSPARLFLATGINEEHEVVSDEIAVIKVPFQDAVKMVYENTITHAPSCMTILKAKEFLERQPTP